MILPIVAAEVEADGAANVGVAVAVGGVTACAFGAAEGREGCSFYTGCTTRVPFSCA